MDFSRRPVRREAERPAFCRGCDRVIPKGGEMTSFYSHRSRGQWIHICPECSKQIGFLFITTRDV